MIIDDTPGPARDGGLAELARQREACAVLLDYADGLPAPLESELHAYVRQLDHAMNVGTVPPPDMTDADVLDAVGRCP